MAGRSRTAEDPDVESLAAGSALMPKSRVRVRFLLAASPVRGERGDASGREVPVNEKTA